MQLCARVALVASGYNEIILVCELGACDVASPWKMDHLKDMSFQ